jgi:hypothetical protein
MQTRGAVIKFCVTRICSAIRTDFSAQSILKTLQETAHRFKREKFLFGCSVALGLVYNAFLCR